MSQETRKFFPTSDLVYCYLEVVETNSVVVKIPKVFLAGEQVRDELVNISKMPTNLEHSVVESAFFDVFSQKTDGLLYLRRTVEYFNRQENH